MAKNRVVDFVVMSPLICLAFSGCMKAVKPFPALSCANIVYLGGSSDIEVLYSEQLTSCVLAAEPETPASDIKELKKIGSDLKRAAEKEGPLSTSGLALAREEVRLRAIPLMDKTDRSEPIANALEVVGIFLAAIFLVGCGLLLLVCFCEAIIVVLSG